MEEEDPGTHRKDRVGRCDPEESVVHGQGSDSAGDAAQGSDGIDGAAGFAGGPRQSCSQFHAFSDAIGHPFSGGLDGGEGGLHAGRDGDSESTRNLDRAAAFTELRGAGFGVEKS